MSVPTDLEVLKPASGQGPPAGGGDAAVTRAVRLGGVSRRWRRKARYLRYLAGRLAALHPRELANLARVQVMLVWAQLLVWLVPRGKLVGVRRERHGAGVDPSTVVRAEAIGRQVVQVAAHGVFRPECLVRSVALQRLLEREGLTGGAVHVGVRLTQGEFDAHAWVEYGGVIVGDREEHVRTFSELTTVTRAS